MMIDSDIAAAVALAEEHVEKCICDQPSMKTELEASLAIWIDRNREHVQRAHCRSDHMEIAQLVRGMLAEDGFFTIEHFQQAIERVRSEERDIDTRLRAERPCT